MEQDERFSHIATDPKFRRIPKGERKVKIDKRFQSMFNDKQFKVKYTTDKRGRPVNHTSTEDLKRYYHLSSDDASSDSEDDSNENLAPGKYVRAPGESSDASIETNELNLKTKSDTQLPTKIKKRLKNLTVDYARGESVLFSESSSDEEDSETENSEAEGVDHAWGELDRDAEKTEESTRRLAACNMDWDRIRATDLMVLLNSFLPAGGLIHSVTIYPSEFGLKRMKEEEIKGPIELVESKNTGDLENNDFDTEEGSKYHMEKLRQYQLNRLKYYYAVIVCDSVNTANKIYTECDGLEYESSATKMDLRFIPDDTTFDEEPKEVCDKLPEQGKYQPRFFTTTALQQAKVDLTWDETNPERIEIAQKLATGKIDDVADVDIQAYLASSSGEESLSENEDVGEETGANPLDKYKALLEDINTQEMKKKERDVEMEISWGINLKEKTDKMVKEKLNNNKEKTPFEMYLEKRKEKKKAKRELKKKPEGTESEQSDVPSDIDMNDPYFAEEFNKPEFKQKKPKAKLEPAQELQIDEQKQAELELLLLNEEVDNKRHFSLKQIQANENESKSKKKRNKKNEQPLEEKLVDDFQINVGDERFAALYSSHHFNIDPTDPHFKKTKATDALINEKLKRRCDNHEEGSAKKAKTEDKKDAELSVLVKSIKRKTEALSKKKK